jgi:hypothetical protein
MQPPSNTTIRDAAATLVAAALRDLAHHDDTPKVDQITDMRNWWRYDQESFGTQRPNAWHMPDHVHEVGWLDTFAEMATVRAAIAADSVLADRVDGMVGTEFSLRKRELGWLLVQHLLEPIIVATRTYAFDEAAFDLHFARLDAGLRADTIRLVEFVPFNGFVTTVGPVMLSDGVVMQEMSDPQMSRAIQVLAVPAEFGGGPNRAQVSRFHQWAITRERCYPVHTGPLPEHPTAPDFPSLEEPAHRLVIALRIVCGGSVVATRPIHAQHDEDFPPTLDATAMRSEVVAADIDRPTMLLTDEQVATVRAVYEMLTGTAVREERSLQVALRRFVFAGSKAHPEDRLLDLIICCEALFIKRPGVIGTRKKAPASENAAHLLADDPVLGAGHDEVKEFVGAAYGLRSALVHADHPVPMSMPLLHGQKTDRLGRFVEDLGLVVGRALHLVLNELTG